MQRSLMNGCTPHDTTPAEPPAEAVLEALEVLDALPSTIRSAAAALAIARLNTPRDHRCRNRRPRKAFRPVVDSVRIAEGELASAWQRLAKVDLDTLVDLATRP